MPLNLANLILYSGVPAFKNFESGEFDLTFSGTLVAPAGPSSDPTTLSVSDSASFSQDAKISTIFIQPNSGYTPNFGSAVYSANDLLSVRSYPNVFCDVSSGGGNSWPLEVNIDLSDDTITVELEAVNAGGTPFDLTFVPTTYTIRYVSFLPTE